MDAFIRVMLTIPQSRLLLRQQTLVLHASVAVIEHAVFFWCFMPLYDAIGFALCPSAFPHSATGFLALRCGFVWLLLVSVPLLHCSASSHGDACESLEQ